MWMRRKLLIALLLLPGVAGLADRAQGQQAYEFGIRFNPVIFRPLNFNRFSFQQTSFRGLNTQPIQFERINFPALNSRTVRRIASRGNIPPQSVHPVFDVNDSQGRERLRIAVTGDRSAISSRKPREESAVRHRLVLQLPAQAVAAGARPGDSNRPTFSSATQFADSRRPVNPYLRSRTSYFRRPFAVPVSIFPQVVPTSARREIVIRRLGNHTTGRLGRGLSSGVRTTRLPADGIAGRSVTRLRLRELTGRTLR
jgi:hypothetical protein